MSDRLIAKLGKPFDPTKKAAKKSSEAMLRDAISTQKEIAKGNRPTNSKGTPIKSWFDKDKERFTPKFGTSMLYGKEGTFPYTPGEELEILEILEDMLENGDLDEQLKPFKEKRRI